MKLADQNCNENYVGECVRLIQETILDQNSNDGISHKDNDYIENGYQCPEINEINR